MDKRFAIFDMDGTLVDSMPAWKNLGRTFLASKGVPIPDDLRRRVATMTMSETGRYFNELGIAGTPEQLADEMNELMHQQYRTTIAPCDGIGDYLEALHRRGVRMCVATATDSRLAATCLTRLDLLRYFEFVVSCEDIGVSKQSPRIYQLAAARLGASDPGDVAVLEDAPYAARTAKQAGFYAVGVYDPSAEARQNELRETVDETIMDYREAARLAKKEAPLMSFSQRLRQNADPIWQGFFAHPFVTGIGDGSLDLERFRFFLLQDYLYLYDYTRVFALGLIKSSAPEEMRFFSSTVDAILNGEMNTHRAYMKRLGISDEQAETVRMALSNRAYTSYMLAVGHTGTAPEIVAAILACSWSYAEIGERLAAIPGAVEHPFYGEWVQGYSSEEYQRVNRSLIERMDALAEGLPPERLDALEEVFLNCSRFEAEFWQMAWDMRE